jgi:hypothetical protein
MVNEYDGEYPNNSQQRGFSIEKELDSGKTNLPGTLRPADTYSPNKSEKTEVSCSATQVQTGSGREDYPPYVNLGDLI